MALQTEIDAAARILSKGCWDGCENEGELASCLFPPCPCRTAAKEMLDAAETARREAHRKALAIAKEEIENSCGCIFCDLGYEPAQHDGQQQHHVRVSKGLRKKVPEPSWVPCTRPR